MGIKYQAPAIVSGFFVAHIFGWAMQQLTVCSCYVLSIARNFE